MAGLVGVLAGGGGLERSRGEAARDPRHQIIYSLLAGLGVVLLFGMFRHDLRAELILWRTPVALAWAMVAVVFAGLLFTWWARIHLGRLWSSSVTRKADHHVVDTGPYGIVRHPIYTGIIRRDGCDGRVAWHRAGVARCLRDDTRLGDQGAAGRKVSARAARGGDVCRVRPPRADACAPTGKAAPVRGHANRTYQ